MKRGFTLLELTVVLAIISILLTLLFPAIVRSDLRSNSSVRTRISTLFSSAFSPGNPVEFCVDFKSNSLKVGKEVVKLPWKIDTLVLPGKVVSSELASKYCFDLKNLIYGAIVAENKNSFPSILFTFPSGEVRFYNLSQAEAETLKDKVEKGRVVEWFSYYSY